MSGRVDLLLVRPDDVVVLGLSWVDLTPVPPAAPDQPSSLRADGANPTLTVTLPPQATAEEPFVPESENAPQARVGGPSELVVAVPPGTTVPLTAAGVLACLRDHGGLDGDIELPWGVHLGPRPRTAGEPLVVTTQVEPVVSPTKHVGMWRARIDAASGLALQPLQPMRPVDDSGGAIPPLDIGARTRIANESQSSGILPTAPELELTAIGGSATFQATWPTYAWEHDIRLGRDMRVRVESKGVLYPFGHRAVLTELTERVFTPPDGTSNVSAGLRSTAVLLISEPVRRIADDGEAAAREFPFDEVEVLGRAFALHPTDHDIPKRYPREPKRLDALEAALNEQVAARDAQQTAVNDLIVALRQQVDADATAAIDALSAEAGAIGQQISDLQAQHQAHVDALNAIPVEPPPPPPELVSEDFPPPPPPPPPDPVEVPPDVDLSGIPGMQAQIDALMAQIQTTQAQRDASLQTLATEDGLASFGGEPAETLAELRRLQELVATGSAHLEDVRAIAVNHLVVLEWPLAPEGERLLLPVRIGDIVLSLPVLFVHDIDFADDDDFPGFTSLTDPGVRSDLDSFWSQAPTSTAPVPAVPLQLVRAEQPKDGDVHEVHELVLAGDSSRGTFRPRLSGMVVDLPAMRMMLPEQVSKATLVFDRAYLETGLGDVALRVKPPAAVEGAVSAARGLAVDFTKAADRVGGLVAPAFVADAVSRAHGLVDAAMLPDLATGPPDLSTIFAGAKLLGIDLAAVVDGLPRPPTLDGVEVPLGLTPVLEGGRPVGVRMGWDLALKNHGPLQVESRSTCRMTVEHRPTGSRICGEVEHVALVLPPGGDLVRVGFSRVAFTKVDSHAPELDVSGVTVELGGDLGLLKTLQTELKDALGDAAPAVRSRPDGISAAYDIALPSVTAGVFIMRDITAHIGVEVPFDGQPVVASLGFASRENPFNLSVSAFGGGGYLYFEIAEKGIRRLEASLDFGATVAIGVGVATAEVHALGGVRFAMQGDDVKVTGFLRIGGSVDVLGLVSVSVELRVELTYENGTLTGQATAVIEIDVTLWSGSVQIDSGRYTFAGASPEHDAGPAVTTASTPPPLPPPPSLSDWQAYRDAFAPAGT